MSSLAGGLLRAPPQITITAMRKTTEEA